MARSGRVLNAEVPTDRRCLTVTDALSFVPFVASLHPQSSASTVHVHAQGAASAVLCVDTRANRWRLRAAPKATVSTAH